MGRRDEPTQGRELAMGLSEALALATDANAYRHLALSAEDCMTRIRAKVRVEPTNWMAYAADLEAWELISDWALGMAELTS